MSLPFSLIADTLVLPVDLVMRSRATGEVQCYTVEERLRPCYEARRKHPDALIECPADGSPPKVYPLPSNPGGKVEPPC